MLWFCTVVRQPCVLITIVAPRERTISFVGNGGWISSGRRDGFPNGRWIVCLGRGVVSVLQVERMQRCHHRLRGPGSSHSLLPRTWLHCCTDREAKLSSIVIKAIGDVREQRGNKLSVYFGDISLLRRHLCSGVCLTRRLSCLRPPLLLA